MIFFFLLSSLLWASDSHSDLQIVNGSHVKLLSLAEMKSKLKSTDLETYNPEYKRKITYQGFWLKDVLALSGYQISTMSGDEADELSFHCADGYTTTLPIAKLSEQKYFVAYQEKNAPQTGPYAGWHPIEHGKKQESPGPYYIVGTDLNSYDVLAWPFQVVKIELINFKEKYSLLYPVNMSPDSDVFRGFLLFKSNCVACHSINLQGGVIGPELNIPKNITEYWSKKTLTQFIKNPSSFRARDRMPVFSQLKDDDIENIILYLKHMKLHKVQSDAQQ